MMPARNFARLSPSSARLVLAALAAAIGLLIAASQDRGEMGPGDAVRRGAGDVALYLAEVERITAGAGYYDAAGAELSERGYPRRSPFNWRTPLPMWLVGVLPQGAGRVIIGALGAILLGLAVHLTGRETGTVSGLVCGLLLVGALLPCWLAEIYITPVVWGGVLIGLSVVAYGLGLPRWGMGFGAAALFVRELAAPYCLVCVGLAMQERRWKEAAGWVAVMAAYFSFFAWHAVQVLSRVEPGDHAHAEGWLRFGGAQFLLDVMQMNSFLLLLPRWATAIYLPLAVLGFAAWQTPAGNRAGATACAFLAMFAFVGQPFNQYWGALIAPLVCLGACQSPKAVYDLVRTALGSGNMSTLAAG